MMEIWIDYRYYVKISLRVDIMVRVESMVVFIITAAYIANHNNVYGCRCGVVSAGDKRKILGGKVSPFGGALHPWAVSLVRSGGSKVSRFCGGSLISDKYVLTAAHCLGSDFKVSLAGNLSNLVDVQNVTPHPDFQRKTLENDVALIQLSDSVTIGPRVRPVCLPEKGKTYTGRSAKVVGWGVVRSNGGTPVQRLREVGVNVLDNGSCSGSYAKGGVKVTMNMMCASGGPGKDSCSGDSGGPLTVGNDENQVVKQIGVVSFGIGCGNPQYPGVYARVTRYLRWIKENTQDSVYCT